MRTTTRRWKVNALLIAAVLLMPSCGHAAHLRLPAIIGSHMVLQQQRPVTLWGWAEKGSLVTVVAGWDNRKRSTHALSDGTWKLHIDTPAAGGPYQIEISADTTILLSDVLVGEVWVCSGQSNMEMPMKGFPSQPVLNGNDHIARSGDPNIRLFTVQRKISVMPEADCSGEWTISSPGTVSGFSAVAWFYGKYLQEVLDVPVGLIHASWGGTPAQSWTDKATLQGGFREIDLSVLSGARLHQRLPTVLFNAMIHPLLNVSIRGVTWYQGEADRMRADQYARLFPAMIAAWRDRWGLGAFPFYFVQIAPYRYDSTCNTAYLREAQLKTMLHVPNTGMAVTMDIGDYHTIHPPQKSVVGERLAYWALSRTYGIQGISYSGPVFREMRVEGETANLFFDHAETGFSGLGREIRGFLVAGSDKVFHPAQATINRKANCIEVRSKHVKVPAAVRYGWDNYVEGKLYNAYGLPASSFRTDNWQAE